MKSISKSSDRIIKITGGLIAISALFLQVPKELSSAIPIIQAFFLSLSAISVIFIIFYSLPFISVVFTSKKTNLLDRLLNVSWTISLFLFCLTLSALFLKFVFDLISSYLRWIFALFFTIFSPILLLYSAKIIRAFRKSNVLSLILVMVVFTNSFLYNLLFWLFFPLSLNYLVILLSVVINIFVFFAILNFLVDLSGVDLTKRRINTLYLISKRLTSFF